MLRHFHIALPAVIFIRNILLVSVAGLTIMLALYAAISPGFGAMLLQGGPGLSRFLRQVATNGLPVVFAANYVGFFLIAASAPRLTSTKVPIAVLLSDIPTRIAVFVVLHIVIYMKSADWFGSFGGSPETALRTVAPTLARAAYFENLSGVYLYAVILCALPAQVEIIVRSGLVRLGRNDITRTIAATVLATTWVAFLLFALTVIAANITVWQQA